VDLLICNSAGRLEPHARAYLGCWRQLDSGKASISAFKRDANPNLTTDLNHRSPSLGNSACTSGINNTRLCLEVASLRDNASIWRKLNCIPQRALIDRSTVIVSSPRDVLVSVEMHGLMKVCLDDTVTGNTRKCCCTGHYST